MSTRDGASPRLERAAERWRREANNYAALSAPGVTDKTIISAIRTCAESKRLSCLRYEQDLRQVARAHDALLEAARKIVKQAERNHVGDAYPEVTWGAVDALRAAIAAAEGEAPLRSETE